MKQRGMFTVLTMMMLAAACSSGNVTSLEVGDCFDDQESLVLGEVAEVSSVPIVDCSEPHDNEVFALYEAADGEFPGQDEMVDIGRAGCVDRFDRFVGMAYLDSELDVFGITPTSEGWERGDRQVVCALYEVTLAKMTGTQRGANR